VTCPFLVATSTDWRCSEGVGANGVAAQAIIPAAVHRSPWIVVHNIVVAS
jgi:hypothetical protein